MLDDNPITDDDDLAKKSQTTNFNIQRIFKYFLLLLCMCLIVMLAVIFTGAIVTSRSFRDAVTWEIKDNVVGIIITALAVIGINLGVLKT